MAATAAIDRRTERVTQVVYLDPGDIQADEARNPRRYPAAHIDEMVKSLLERGQEVPIKVVVDTNDNFILRWGGRRWQAARVINDQKLYDPEIWPHGFRLACVVVTDPPPAKNKAARAERDRADLVAAIAENVDRLDMSVPDKAHAMARLKDEFGMNQQEVANVFQCSEGLVSRYLKLATLHKYDVVGETLQRLMQDDTVSWRLVLEALEYSPREQAEKALAIVAASAESGMVITSDGLRAAMRLDNTDAYEAAVAGAQANPLPDNGDMQPAPAAAPAAIRKRSAPRAADAAEEPHVKPRTSKEILADLQDYVDRWDANSEEGAEKPNSVLFCGHLAKYIRGVVGWRYIANRLKEAYEES